MFQVCSASFWVRDRGRVKASDHARFCGALRDASGHYRPRFHAFTLSWNMRVATTKGSSPRVHAPTLPSNLPRPRGLSHPDVKLLYPKFASLGVVSQSVSSRSPRAHYDTAITNSLERRGEVSARTVSKDGSAPSANTSLGAGSSDRTSEELFARSIDTEGRALSAVVPLRRR
jgi:hypothetical protein